MRKPNTKCIICKKDFYKRPNTITECCSVECMKINIFNKTLERIKTNNNINDLKLWFKDSYLNKKDSYRIISKKLGINERTVKKILLYYGIQIRYGSESIKSQWVDNRRKKRIQENDYIECESYYKVLAYDNNKNLKGYFLIDKDDFEKIKSYQWHLDNNGYARTVIKHNNKKEFIKLHRYLINATYDEFVDHINGKRYDNRKNNLRICTMQQNALNRCIAKNNTSGVKGVSKRKNGKWQADITFKGNSYYLGTFKNFEDAVKARKSAEEKYFKEFIRI